MQDVIDILRHQEAVLMKKIKGMKDGKPKYAASERVNQIRQGIRVLQEWEKSQVDSIGHE
ncbi:hypothetical protein UFOVP449_45 [uncultured Caudovirales phage]|uniref:Uncharacterized protein n=1 Tax=uncultured Caudovirales phage TaxID=2100421 RepID=A0A6J5M6P6_9CAUD|nr:hypothetical protein UFOVP449_45 [uncultured Caudovirales phage]